MNRKVALIGETRTGKSTFLMSNARGNIWAVDAEHALERYKDLAEGKLFYPSPRGCVDPIHIFLEAEDNMWDKDIGTIGVDAVTKIYGRQSRVASMAGRLTKAQRERLGFGKSKAKDMIGKADAIQVLTNLIVYGTDVMYIWHEGEYLDVASKSYEMVRRDAISDVERNRLMTSVDIVLRFSIEKGSYRVYVDPETRNIGRQPARTGFYLNDPPGNFWAGTMDKLENLIYLSFESPAEAIKWGSQALGVDEATAKDLYDNVKDEQKPKTSSAMWFAYVSVVYAAGNDKPIRIKSDNEQGPEKPKKEPTKKPDPISPPAPSPDYTPEPDALEGVEDVYGDGEKVALDDLRDFHTYVKKFGRIPHDRKLVMNSKQVHLDTDKPWHEDEEE